ncbi:MAG: hypothetical protein K6F48_11600 [Paludibacteraceae bacterium]|nr:hypothetical protein [Paludibacteraceae bacterium]
MGRPAVSVAWMVEEGIITLANCKKMVIRRDLEQASRGSRNHPALVFVDNMPLRFRGQVIEKLGDIYEAMETTILDIHLSKDFPSMFEKNASNFADSESI